MLESADHVVLRAGARMAPGRRVRRRRQVHRHAGGREPVAQHVLADAPGQAVRTRAALQCVVAVPAGQRVVAPTPLQIVGLGVACQTVGVLRADDMLESADHIVLRAGACMAPGRRVRRRGQIHRHAGGREPVAQHVLAGAPGQGVRTRAALQRVVAAPAVQLVVAAQAQQVVVAGSPGEIIVADRSSNRHGRSSTSRAFHSVRFMRTCRFPAPAGGPGPLSNERTGGADGRRERPRRGQAQRWRPQARAARLRDA